MGGRQAPGTHDAHQAAVAPAQRPALERPDGVDLARHGDVMTRSTVANDPDFLAEPMVKSQSFRLIEETGANWLWRISRISRV